MKIVHKLFLALFLSGGTTLVLMAFLMQWSLDRGFLDYVNQLDEERVEKVIGRLAAEYGDRGGFDHLKRNHPRWHFLLAEEDVAARSRGGHRRGPPRPLDPGDRPPREPDSDMREGAPGEGEYVGRVERDQKPLPRTRRPRRRPPPRGGPPDHLQLGRRLTLFDQHKTRVIGAFAEGQELRPIWVDGREAGWLGVSPLKRVTAPKDVSFLKQQSRTFMGFALILILVVVLASVLLARHLLKPIRALAVASNSLSAGRFSTRVMLGKSRDELGRLAQDFNNLAHTLQQNEQARREWVADISHELRTPLSVLRGELEALQDGIRRWKPETLDSLHAEVLCLVKLVDDLYELSLSDLGALCYKKERIDPELALTQILPAFQMRMTKRHLRFESNSSGDVTSRVLADPQRLMQLFSNILENSLRYTDPGGGVKLEISRDEEQWFISFSDSVPGVKPSDCARLFERFYRVENSRSRNFGGAGLGLAICRKIVDAHEGTIEASPSPLGGLTIKISLPIAR